MKLSYVSKSEISLSAAAERLWVISAHSYEHGSPWSLEQFKADLDQKTSDYLALVQDGCWIGFVSYHLILDEVEITHVAIHKDFQHQGFGRELLSEAIQYFAEQKITQIFLEVRLSNKTAQKLYETVGFEVINRRKNYYHHPQEDGLMMCLKNKEVEQ